MSHFIHLQLLKYNFLPPCSNSFQIYEERVTNPNSRYTSFYLPAVIAFKIYEERVTIPFWYLSLYYMTIF